MKGENNIHIAYPEGRFTSIATGFLAYKRGLGYKYDDGRMYTLRKILVQLNCYEPEIPELTEEMVWEIQKKRPEETDSSRITRITLLRQLALYMNNIGYKAYILPCGFCKYPKTIFKAFIYSRQEIESLIKYCDSYCAQSLHLSISAKIVYPFLLRTLYACGLRISEALRLKSGDVNLKEKFLFIRESKKNKSRYIPLSSSLAENLLIYERMKAEYGIPSYDGSYFPSPDGFRYSRSAASRQIKGFISQAGIRKTSLGSYPRIHDIRHTAAVRILEGLDERGLDLNQYLSLLSFFLGHETFWETEQYLQLPYYSFNRMQGLAGILNIIPEVDEE